MSKFEIGQRVQTGAGSSVKTGVVAFIGETSFSSGEWVGIVLDGPEGKNDGSVAGVRYFECAANYGLFVKAAQVKPSTLPLPVQQQAEVVPQPSESLSGLPSPVPAPSKPDTSSGTLPLPSTAEKDTREKLAALREKRKAREQAAEIASTANVANLRSPDASKDMSSYKTTPPSLSSLAAPSTSRSVPDNLLMTNAAVSDRSSEIDQLTRRVFELETELQQISEEILQKSTNSESSMAMMTKKIERLEKSLIEKTNQLEIERNNSKTIIHSSSSSDEVQELKNQISALNDTIEMLSLDKEQFMVDNELAEEVQTKLKAQVAQMQNEINVSKNFDQKALVDENAKLREALKRLNEVASNSKEEALSSNRQVETTSKELIDLRQYKNATAAELEDLRRTLNEGKSGEYEMMIESLSERNHQLQARTKQLEMTVQDLESAQEMMEELDLNQRAELDRLRRCEDSLNVALRDRDQNNQLLEAKCADLRKIVDTLSRNMNVTKDESQALKTKLQAHSEELEESSSKVRSASSLKLEIETLSERLAAAVRLKSEAELKSLHSQLTAGRMSYVFGDVSLWRQELSMLSQELEVVSATHSSVSSYMQILETLRGHNLNSNSVLAALGCLRGVHLSWINACNQLELSSQSLLDTSMFRDLLSGQDTISSILPHLTVQSITRSSGMLEREKLLVFSFFLHAIELLVTCIPRLETFDGNDTNKFAAENCRIIANDLHGRTPEQFLTEFETNLNAFGNAYGSLLNLVISTGSSAKDYTDTAMGSITSLKKNRGGSSGLSILDVSSLLTWSSGSVPALLECHWMSRVALIRSDFASQERDHLQLSETTKALETLKKDYELRKEEAKAATQRAQELRKLLDVSGSGSDKTSLTHKEEVKTLTEALEVLELRNESLEKEIKKINARSGGFVGSTPGAHSEKNDGATRVEFLYYWRKLATYKLAAHLPSLSMDNSKAESFAGTPSLLSSYRAKRLERACFRVLSNNS